MDYLRRSGASGFLLPLSGGADSASTCAIVGIMCKMVIDQCKTCLSTNSLDRSIIHDVERICGIESLTIDNNMISAKELANRIMHTCFMGTTHSSQATRNRALQLATEIGVYHCDANMNPITQAFENVFQTMTGKGKLCCSAEVPTRRIWPYKICLAVDGVRLSNCTTSALGTKWWQKKWIFVGTWQCKRR